MNETNASTVTDTSSRPKWVVAASKVLTEAIFPFTSALSLVAAAISFVVAVGGMVAWTTSPLAASMIVIGLSGVPPLLSVGAVTWVLAHKAVGIISGFLSVIAAALFLGLVWYPDLGRSGLSSFDQVRTEAENRARFGACAQRTYLPLPTVALSP